jgi:hypothetical protein
MTRIIHTTLLHLNFSDLVDKPKTLQNGMSIDYRYHIRALATWCVTCTFIGIQKTQLLIAVMKAIS